MTTVINTHDMNSLMQIGERILFIKEGCMAWSGVNTEVFKSDNQDLQDFVFSSELYKTIKQSHK